MVLSTRACVMTYSVLGRSSTPPFLSPIFTWVWLGSCSWDRYRNLVKLSSINSIRSTGSRVSWLCYDPRNCRLLGYFIALKNCTLAWIVSWWSLLQDHLSWHSPDPCLPPSFLAKHELGGKLHISAKKGVDLWLYLYIVGWTLKLFMHYSESLDCVYVFLCNYSCLIGTLRTQWLSSIATVVKVGGGMGQGSATEVIHLRLNQPPVFPVWSNSHPLTSLGALAVEFLDYGMTLKLHNVGVLYCTQKNRTLAGIASWWSNILLIGEGNRAKVTDFGMAKFFNINPSIILLWPPWPCAQGHRHAWLLRQ